MWSTYWEEVSDEVKEFYRTVTAAISVYYLTLPAICILAGLFSPWVREKYTARAEIAARFLAMCLLAYSLRPSRLDVIINSRLEEGMDSDMDYGDSGDELEDFEYHGEGQGNNREVRRPLTGNMEHSYDHIDADCVGTE